MSVGFEDFVGHHRAAHCFELSRAAARIDLAHVEIDLDLEPSQHCRQCPAQAAAPRGPARPRPEPSNRRGRRAPSRAEVFARVPWRPRQAMAARTISGSPRERAPVAASTAIRPPRPVSASSRRERDERLARNCDVRANRRRRARDRRELLEQLAGCARRRRRHPRIPIARKPLEILHRLPRARAPEHPRRRDAHAARFVPERKPKRGAHPVRVEPTKGLDRCAADERATHPSTGIR